MTSKLAAIREQIAKLEKQAEELRASEINDLKNKHLEELKAAGLTFEEVWADKLAAKQAKPAAKSKQNNSSEAKPPAYSWKDDSGKVHYLHATGKASEALRASAYYKDGKILRENMYKLTEADQKKWLADNAKK